MKPYKFALILSLCIGLSVFLINQIYLKDVLQKKLVYHQEQDFQNFINERHSISYLFLGGSHTKKGVNPHYIQDSFNLGSNSETYIENYYKLKKIIYHDDITIKTLVLEIDPHIMNAYMMDVETPLENDQWYYINFVPLKEISNITGQSVIRILLQAHIPSLGKATEIFMRKELSEQFLGWQKTTEKLSDTNMTDAIKKRISGQYFGTERIKPILLDYYTRILRLAKDNNITLVLIRYPLPGQYNKFLAANNITHEEYYKVVKNNTENIIETYYVLDYNNLLKEHPEYFRDADHLNYLGAEILSKQIQKDLIKFTPSKLNLMELQ